MQTVELSSEEVEITLSEFADWIIKNRKKMAFVGWDKEQLLNNIMIHANSNTILFGYHNQIIDGIVLWTESPAYKMIHINQLLSVNSNFLKRIIGAFQLRYGAEWKIRGNRHGLVKDYSDNTFKLLSKLIAYAQRKSDSI